MLHMLSNCEMSATKCCLRRGDIRGDIFSPDYNSSVLIKMKFRSLHSLFLTSFN